RSNLYWTSISLAIFVGVVAILLAAGSLGATAITTMEDSGEMEIGEFIAAGYNFLPSVLFFVGLAALVLGRGPKRGIVVYVYLIYSLVVNYFGGILDLPEWFSKTASQSWIPQLPTEDFDLPLFITISVISIVLMVIGSLGYKRRDMIE